MIALLLALVFGVGSPILDEACAEPGEDVSSLTQTAGEPTEGQVAEIVNATVQGDVKKVAALLKATPSLVSARWTSGGPVSGWPLLTIAASEGNKKLVELFLSSGAAINETNLSNETALHYAAAKGHKAIVSLLLSKKPELSAKNDVGATPLSLAKAAGHKDIVKMLEKAGATE